MISLHSEVLPDTHLVSTSTLLYLFCILQDCSTKKIAQVSAPNSEGDPSHSYQEPPKFGESVLFRMDSYDSESRRCIRFAYFCTASNSISKKLKNVSKSLR
jgi:hypothetical protein